MRSRIGANDHSQVVEARTGLKLQRTVAGQPDDIQRSAVRHAPAAGDDQLGILVDQHPAQFAVGANSEMPGAERDGTRADDLQFFRAARLAGGDADGTTQIYHREIACAGREARVGAGVADIVPVGPIGSQRIRNIGYPIRAQLAIPAIGVRDGH